MYRAALPTGKASTYYCFMWKTLSTLIYSRHRNKMYIWKKVKKHFMNKNRTETLPNLSCGLCLNLNVQLCRWCPVAPKQWGKWSVWVHCIKFAPVKNGNEKNISFAYQEIL